MISIVLLIGLVLFLLFFWKPNSKSHEKFYEENESLYGTDAYLFLRVVTPQNKPQDPKEFFRKTLFEFVILSESMPEIPPFMKFYGPIAVALKAPSFHDAQSMMVEDFGKGEYDKLWVSEVNLGNGNKIESQRVIDWTKNGAKLRE